MLLPDKENENLPNETIDLAHLEDHFSLENENEQLISPCNNRTQFSQKSSFIKKLHPTKMTVDLPNPEEMNTKFILQPKNVSLNLLTQPIQRNNRCLVRTALSKEQELQHNISMDTTQKMKSERNHYFPQNKEESVVENSQDAPFHLQRKYNTHINCPQQSHIQNNSNNLQAYTIMRYKNEERHTFVVSESNAPEFPQIRRYENDFQSSCQSTRISQGSLNVTRTNITLPSDYQERIQKNQAEGIENHSHDDIYDENEINERQKYNVSFRDQQKNRNRYSLSLRPREKVFLNESSMILETSKEDVASRHNMRMIDEDDIHGSVLDLNTLCARHTSKAKSNRKRNNDISISLSQYQQKKMVTEHFKHPHQENDGASPTFDDYLHHFKNSYRKNIRRQVQESKQIRIYQSAQAELDHLQRNAISHRCQEEESTKSYLPNLTKNSHFFTKDNQKSVNIPAKKRYIPRSQTPLLMQTTMPSSNDDSTRAEFLRHRQVLSSLAVRDETNQPNKQHYQPVQQSNNVFKQAFDPQKGLNIYELETNQIIDKPPQSTTCCSSPKKKIIHQNSGTRSKSRNKRIDLINIYFDKQQLSTFQVQENILNLIKKQKHKKIAKNTTKPIDYSISLVHEDISKTLIKQKNLEKLYLSKLLSKPLQQNAKPLIYEVPNILNKRQSC